jgi:chromosome segregation ATPase
MIQYYKIKSDFVLIFLFMMALFFLFHPFLCVLCSFPQVELSKFFQEKLREAEHRQKELQRQIDEKERIAKAAPNIEKAIFDARVSELQAEIRTKDDIIREQNHKLRRLDGATEENLKLSNDLEVARSEYLHAKHEFDDAIEALKVQHMEAEHSLQDEIQTELHQIEKTSMQNAKQKLTQVSRELIGDNSELKKEVLETRARCQTLVAENSKLQEQLATAKRSVYTFLSRLLLIH